jgi:tripartite-type tricarboxylate transporter receptor subunit TctC
MNTFATLLRVALVCTAACAVDAARAQQDFPAKPVTVVIPFPPGTGNDVVGRTVGTKLGEILNQRFIADNRAGASGNIAIDQTRRALPDGYTLVVASTSFSINLYTMKVGFGLADFTPVALLGRLPFTLMVAKSVPARTIRELAELIKNRPGQYNAASGGPTGTSFFLLESFKKAAGFDIQMVPYKGTTDGMVDLIAERTHMMFAPMVTSLGHYRSGKIQLHGVTGTKRSVLVPEVPTFNESGYPMLDIATWFALLGPAGIPSNVVKVLSDATAKALAAKDVVDQLTKVGVEPGFGTPAELDAFLKADVAMWGRMVKEAGIKPQ